MRELPALVCVAALIAPLASAGCYSVPDLQPPDGGMAANDGSSRGGDGSGGGSGSSSGSSGSSSGSSGSSGGGTDGSSPKDAGCTGVLCPCNNATDCASGVCAQSMTVGSALYTAAGGTNFCTQPCCTSSDCPAGTVCFASGAGGQYCVDPAWLGRAKPASTAIGGAGCSTGSDCRSGLCAGSACADTCCSMASTSSECANPARCVLGTFPGKQGIDTHFAPHCGAAGPIGFGGSCVSDTDCQGGFCFQTGMGGACTGPCRGENECGSGNSCEFDTQGNDVYAACFPLGTGQGSGGIGASCTADTQCLGLYCNGGSNGNGQCSGPCFTDYDCTAVPGWHCTPQLMIMFTPGNYTVLGCGP